MYQSHPHPPAKKMAFYEIATCIFASSVLFVYISFCAYYTFIVERRQRIRELNEP